MNDTHTGGGGPTKYERVIAALEAHGCVGDGRGAWQCPAHDDTHPSLGVDDGPNGVLIHCRAGCDTLAVLDVLGFGWPDLFEEPRKHWRNSTMRSVGASIDKDGRVRLGGVRYAPGAEPKALASKAVPRGLFPDPTTIDGPLLFVVEGEPDAVTAADIGLPAVAIPGAGKWSPTWGEWLARGRERVVVIPDCDSAGHMAAQRCARAVAMHCADVRILVLEPDRDDGYDLSDFAADARNDAERAQVREAILRAAESSPRISAPQSQNGAKPPPSNARYADRIIDVRAMLATPDDPITWRCDGIAADGFLTVLAGRGKEGKSWLMLALACGVARGRMTAGVKCVKGKSLIFDAENGQRLIKRRFHAAAITADLDVQPVETGGLGVVQDLQWFRDTVTTYRANLVIFDSLKVLSRGAKENSSDEMEPILTSLKLLSRDTGAAVVVIHHRGRSEESDFRGASAILDQTDMMLRLHRVKGDPEKARRQLVTVGCRFEEEPDPRWFQIVADRAQGLVTVDEAEPYETEEYRPRDTHRDDVLNLLGGIARSERNIAKATDLPRTSVQRILKDLEEEGLAEKRPDGWVAHPGVAHRGGPCGPPFDFGSTTPFEAAQGGGPTGGPPGPPPDADCANSDEHREQWTAHPETGRAVCPICHPGVTP